MEGCIYVEYMVLCVYDGLDGWICFHLYVDGCRWACMYTFTVGRVEERWA